VICSGPGTQVVTAIERIEDWTREIIADPNKVPIGTTLELPVITP
jgi:hypothetical protein